jgi:hypothetical protein
VQVKTRREPLVYSDIEGAMQRFDALRKEHESCARKGNASFIIATNAPPGPQLATRLTGYFPPLPILATRAVVGGWVVSERCAAADRPQDSILVVGSASLID